ncbi:MAG: tetratricopeptide repeat protein [Cyanobacteria bacterium RU_5_0]|nr:tetratricopeptide repeat protein [Cyanobacteria bacterium RU_5_0]
MRRAIAQTILITTLLSLSWDGFSTAKLALAQSAAQYRESGIAYRDQGQMMEAIAALQKAVELEPDYIPGYVNLGWTLHLAGQDREAADVLQTAIQRDPFHVQTFNAIGIIYLVNNDLAGAVLAHNWAKFLKPDNEIAHYNLSLAYQRVGEFDWAIEAATQAAALEPENPHPLVALAIAHWDEGDQAAAQHVYQQAIDLDSRYADSGFLDYLNEAGFSPDQIEKSKQVLRSFA